MYTLNLITVRSIIRSRESSEKKKISWLSLKYCAYTPKERIYITAEYKLPWYYNNKKKRLTLTVKVKNDLYKYTSIICTVSYKNIAMYSAFNYERLQRTAR